VIDNILIGIVKTLDPFLPIFGKFSQYFSCDRDVPTFSADLNSKKSHFLRDKLYVSSNFFSSKIAKIAIFTLKVDTVESKDLLFLHLEIKFESKNLVQTVFSRMLNEPKVLLFRESEPHAFALKLSLFLGLEKWLFFIP
jgi:hypothetical protein